jgi:hypothetical protein
MARRAVVDTHPGPATARQGVRREAYGVDIGTFPTARAQVLEHTAATPSGDRVARAVFTVARGTVFARGGCVEITAAIVAIVFGVVFTDGIVTVFIGLIPRLAIKSSSFTVLEIRRRRVRLGIRRRVFVDARADGVVQPNTIKQRLAVHDERKLRLDHVAVLCGQVTQGR